MKANIYMIDGFETVEALAIADILRRAEIETELISVTGSCEVTSAQNIVIKADRLFSEKEELAELLFLPGGIGSLNFKDNDKLKALFMEQNEKKGLIAAICAAPTVLAHWGLLKCKNAICFPGMEKDMLGAKLAKAPARVVIDGNIITARGMGTAVDLGLAIVDKMLGEAKASQLGLEIQYLEDK